MPADTQLLGISNAIVDVLAHVEPGFIADIGATVGAMNLIDEERAGMIYERMGPATEMSGGSVANTVAGFATLGGKAAYIGHVRADQLGEIFNHDMRSLGVDIRLAPADEGAPTARSYILITPDGQRTMNTYLGSCTELALADVTPATVGRPRILLLEGYVWDIAEGPALAARAIEIAAREGATVALSLSDALCVDRHRESFQTAIEAGVDIVIANESEIQALLGVSRFGFAEAEVARYGGTFVMTRSSLGSVIVRGDEHVVQPAIAVSEVVDTTGAGDAYSAGFLYGWTSEWSLADCAKLATYCASQVIRQVGARIPPGVLESYGVAASSSGTIPSG
jgi:sugar/nucleoside kinase (ribokinase family)